MARKPLFLLFIFGGYLLMTCDGNRIFQQNIEVDVKGWAYDSELTFDYSIDNTDDLYSMYLTVEHSMDYAYQNIYFNSKYGLIDGSLSEDIFSIDLADKTGQWYGDCSSDKCLYKVLLQPNIQYDKPGEYQFTIIQNTRDSLLSGVSEIGMRLELEN